MMTLIDDLKAFITHQDQLRREYVRALHVQELKAASFGIHIPYHLQHELEMLRTSIAACESERTAAVERLTNAEQQALVDLETEGRLALKQRLVEEEAQRRADLDQQLRDEEAQRRADLDQQIQRYEHDLFTQKDAEARHREERNNILLRDMVRLSEEIITLERLIEEILTPDYMGVIGEQKRLSENHLELHNKRYQLELLLDSSSEKERDRINVIIKDLHNLEAKTEKLLEGAKQTGFAMNSAIEKTRENQWDLVKNLITIISEYKHTHDSEITE